MLAAARVGKLILQLRQRSLQVSRLQPSTASALGRHQLRAMSEQQKAQTAGYGPDNKLALAQLSKS